MIAGPLESTGDASMVQQTAVSFQAEAVRSALEGPAVADFCRRWRITELALFGSALRDDFRPDSDIDLLVTFESDVTWSLIDHVRMEDELSSLLGREVDLVSRRAIERSRNWIRRRAILDSARPVYAA